MIWPVYTSNFYLYNIHNTNNNYKAIDYLKISNISESTYFRGIIHVQ